ncbi:MAG TPA: hypothetical protein VGN37_06150 [Actinocatenispora sp.]
MAAVIASALALLTAVMLVWFALYDVVHAAGPTGGGLGLVLENVLGGAVGAGLLLVAAGLTFTRRLLGAWSLCALCVLYPVAIFVAPLLRGTALSAQVTWVFGFDKSNGIALALMIIFAVLTAVAAAIAGGVRSYGPPTATVRDHATVRRNVRPGAAAAPGATEKPPVTRDA